MNYLTYWSPKYLKIHGSVLISCFFVEDETLKEYIMGWCSGTYVFDEIAKAYLEDKNPTELMIAVGKAMQNADWDCEYDSDYFNDSRMEAIWIKMGIDPNEEF